MFEHYSVNNTINFKQRPSLNNKYIYMKKLYFSLTLIFSSILISNTFNVNSQLSSTVDIGTGTVTNQAIPIEPYYGYTYSQSLYLASEIGGAIDPITAIQFYATTSTTLANSDLWDVWIKEVPTTFANFNNATNFEDITTFTQVFSGQVTINNGVVRIEFSTPFTYTGTGNIIIAVDQNKPGYDSGAHDFYCSNDGTNDARAITYRSDATNPNPSSPPTGFSVGGRSNYPNITFISEQQSVDIGTGTVTGQAIPVEPYYGYTYSQSLYLSSEMGSASGPITGVKFYATPATTLANSDLWDVWIKEVPNTFANFNTQNFEEISTFTQVFNGQVTINNGVVRVDFSSPFQYTGSGNIIIAVDQNRPGYDSGSHDFYCTGSGNGDYRAVAYRSDGTNPNPATAHTVFAGVNNGRTSYPNITFLSESCSPPTSLTASNVTTSSADISWTAGGTETSWNFDYGPAGYTQGQGPSTIAANPNSLFVGGANSTWSYIHPLVITTDGAASQAAQTYTINVTSLPASGAKARLIKSTANGGAAFTPSATGQALVLGANTFTASAVSFNRYVKIQFDNDQFEFNSIDVNGTSVYTSGSSVSATSASLSGLTSNTTYDAYVQADCGNDVSSWVGPFSFTTPCGSLPVPFSEGFSSTLPSCWSMSGGENWLFNTSGPNHVGNAGNLSGSTFSGGHYAVIDASGYSGANGSALLESPIIDVSSLTTAELTFYLISNEEGTGYSSTLTVEVNGGSSWDTVGSYTGNTAGWEQKTINLSAYTSTVQLRFGFSEQSISSAYYDDIAIDDIDVHETPSCFAASGLSSSNLTATTADVSWTATNSSSFNVEYGPSNFAQGSGTTAVVSASVTIADNPNSLFYAGPTAWPHVSNLALTADGASSQSDQTFTINVTSLPAGGTNWRLIKQNQTTGASFVPTGSVGQPLVLGVNTLTAPASTWNRYVKAQFQNNTFEFDAISINGISVYSSSNTSLTGLSPNTQYDFYVQNDCGVTNGTATWSAPSSFTTTPSPTIIPSCEDFETGSPGASTALNAAANASATVIAGAAANSSAYGVQLTGPDAFVPGAWTGGSVSTTEAQAWGTNVTTHSNIAFNVDATAESVVILTFDLRQTYTFGPKYSWFRVTVNGTQIGASINPISNTDPFVNQSYDLSAYAGTNFNLKLEHAGKYSPAYSTAYPGDRALIDNICISAPNCLAPTALTSSAITATSANFSWTVNGTETAWEVEYGPFGFTQGSGNTSAFSLTNISLIMLTAQTQYDVYVRADCGSGSTSSWVGPYTFTTSCAAAAAPYLENFDASFPVCWSQSTTDNFNWTLDASGTPSSGTGPSDDITSGGNYMFIETSSGANGDSAVLLSQAIDLSALTVPQLRFYSHMYGGTINTLNVDISVDAGVTFTQVFTKSGDQGNQWNEEFVDLSSYSGTVLFRITASRGTSFSGDIAIDNFEIREAPTCVAPTSLTTANLTNSSVDISWTAGGTETAWNIEYGPDGFTQGSGTSLPLSATTASLTGLTALTEYDFYVQADCGRGLTSTWNGPYSFTIPGPGDCSSSVTYSYSNNSTLASSLKGFVANTPGDYITLTFTAGSTESGYDYWYINDAANGNGNTIATGDGSITSVNGGVFESTTGEISFYVISDGSVTGTPFVFSASCAAPPACADPTLLTASNLTDTTADISWTGTASAVSYNIEYGIAGFTPGTGTSFSNTGLVTSLTGLTANTQYDVYVQSNCGTTSGLSDTTGPFTFTTECAIVSTFPYTMGFENGFGCWSTVDVNGGNSWGAFTAQGLGGTIAAGIQYQSSAHDDHLISPKFSVTSNSSRFSFNATDYFNYPESFDVLVSTTGKAAADFTDTISSEVASGGYSYYQYDLSSYIGQDVYVSIHSTSTNQYYLFVDDVTIDEFISKTILQSETACDSYTWSVNGTSYTSDTSLTVFSPAVDVTDSDSTFILNLTVNSSISITETITACDSLSWNGNTYFASDSTATASLLTSSGCDSIVTLNLTINNSSLTSETNTVCDTYDWQGNTYTTSGNYSYSDTTVNGCDSTINLVLTVNSSSSSLLTTTACNTFTWKGSTFTSSGIYVAPAGTNFAGCPQVDSLDLTITTIATSDTQTACDSYTWDGNTYTTSGTYYSSSACVDTLYLTVNASSSSSSTVAACDSSVWNGITYFTSGTYNVFTTNAAGCDSTATLNLTVGNSASNTVTVSECDSYNWNGTTYTSSGVYSGVFQTSTGCDSTVNLVLTINSSSNQSVTVFSCDEYTWDGVSYTASGDYTNNYTSVSGCDSTVTLVLTIGTTAAPFTEGFDINFPNCWSQPDSTDGEDALDWTRNSFATLSQGTGPSDDVIGGGHYMYIESSSPAQHGDNAIMYSNFIDISSLTNPELRFFSHMYGESTGSLTVEIQGENDTVPTTIFSKSGDHGDLWIQERVIFTSTSNRVKFKITGTLDSNSLGAVWAGDMAIDEFGVREAVPNDLAIIAAAVNSDCELTTTEPIELWVVNNGLVDQADFKLSYSINGGAPVLDSIIQFVNIGDTLRHIFTTTADMSMDGIYDIDFACILAIDADATDNVLNFVAENYTTPADAVTEGDTICFVGDFGQISAISDGWIYWYDSLVGGSLVGENDTLFVSPSATTSYFAEVSVYNGFEEDFESYSPGDLIAQTSNDWNTWSNPNGGADDDAEVTDFVSAGGSNSLYLNDDNSDDIVLPLGNTYSSGTFNFETDMYIETEAYLNFQEGIVNGEAWAFDIYFNDTTINVEIDDSTVLTVAYNPNNPLGAPVWFNFGLNADLDNGQWKMFKDGISLGTFAMNDEISSVNFWASTGNDYYIDNVKWSAWGGDACRSLSRTEAVVVLDSCNTTIVSEVSFENLKIYPNPNNGSFTIANSELINSVVIMDLQGKVVYRNSNLNLYNLNVNLENLDRGMYMINIISENEITTKSIILN